VPSCHTFSDISYTKGHPAGALLTPGHAHVLSAAGLNYTISPSIPAPRHAART